MRALRAALGLLSLAGLLTCAALIVASAARWPSPLVPSRFGGMPGWLRGLWHGPAYFLEPADFATTVAVMSGCYLVALVTVGALRLRWVLAVIVALHGLFVIGPPLISSDVFGYLDWARMAVLHGLNPYTTDSGAVVSDPVYPFIGWNDLVSPYGPLFTLATMALVPLGLPASLWALKVAATAASLGCVFLIARTAPALGRDPLAAVALYGLNPAVLVYAVGGFHNDTIMMLAVVAAVHLLVTGRERAAGVMGGVAVAIKSSSGLVMPFLILGTRERRTVLTAAVATGAAVLLVALAAFGWHAFGFLNVLGTQQALDSPTSVPAQLGVVLGWEGSPSAVRIVCSAAGLAALALCLVSAWRGADWIACAAWATVALLVTTSWLLAWYVVWLAPLAALARGRLLAAATAGLTLFVILVRAAPNLG